MYKQLLAKDVYINTGKTDTHLAMKCKWVKLTHHHHMVLLVLESCYKDNVKGKFPQSIMKKSKA